MLTPFLSFLELVKKRSGKGQALFFGGIFGGILFF